MKTKGAVLFAVAMAVAYMVGCTGPVFAGDRYEPDNSRDAYGNIGVGEAQNHTLDPIGDVDWTRFFMPSTPCPATYRITITNTGTSSLSLEEWWKDGWLPEFKFAWTNTPLKPGQYVTFTRDRNKSGITFWTKYKVWQQGGLKGSYSIKVARVK